MTTIMMEQIENARKKYLETFAREKYFLKVYNMDFCEYRPETAIELMKESNDLKDLPLMKFLDKGDFFRRLKNFSSSLEIYTHHVASRLVLNAQDEPLVLGYKIGYYLENLRHNLRQFVDETNLYNQNHELYEEYKEAFFKFAKDLRDIVGLDFNLMGNMI